MITSPSFEKLLKWGKVGETVIASWLRSRGWTVLPVYDIPLDTGKGPSLYTAFNSGHGELVAPDMLTMNGLKIQWVEAKRKTHFTWRWTTGHWQTGIDLRHYGHYLHVREVSNLPLWLMFLHIDSTPSPDDIEHGCPAICPVGLFGGEIRSLDKAWTHKDGYQKNGRRYPMVYWNRESLVELASLDTVLSASRSAA